MTDQPTWMIVGLGNPGKRYERTRHNVGFMVVDELRRDFHCRTVTRRFDAEIAEAATDRGRVILVKPQTFMNLSGNSVGAAQRWYRLPLSQVLIIYDDLDLPFGQIRLRPSGSSGGHNGMASIINRLGTQDFPRLRLGIGRSEHTGTIGYVLSRFTSGEEKQLRDHISQAAAAAKAWHEDGIEVAMNRFNRRESTGTQSG
ncbi:MAG TPA: aminoacyl-tRNA hydrolase [Nitrolancea sp.]|nr:aminoacyl-tRNA hydrolase [Nitrolancea sp.]